MSQLPIHDDLSQLDRIKKVSGSQRETIVREAFIALLPYATKVSLQTVRITEAMKGEAR